MFGWARKTIRTSIIIDPGFIPTMFYGQNIKSLKQLKQLGTDSNKNLARRVLPVDWVEARMHGPLPI